MAAKKKTPGITGSVHPAVIEAAGLDCDRPEQHAWIAMRYNEKFHPLPVYFAEIFDQWNRAPENERERQIRLEESGSIEGRFTLLGASMGDGILRCRERFAKACAIAVTVGDREFFRSFDEVYFGLAGGRFPIPLRAAVIRGWQFLTLLRGGRMMKWNVENQAYEDHCVMAGDFPTVAEIRNYLEAITEREVTKTWPACLEDSIRSTLKKHGLAFADDKVGGDRRSKAIKAR
jgi:hypothetical protein